MNRKIPFHELGSILAHNCNITSDEAEDFIKNFFDLIAQSLIKGESVKIKGIGTFAPSGDTEHPVAFTPDAEIADTINAPFALFEPEFLNDTVSEADLMYNEAEAATTDEKIKVESETITETGSEPMVDEVHERESEESDVEPAKEQESAPPIDEGSSVSALIEEVPAISQKEPIEQKFVLPTYHEEEPEEYINDVVSQKSGAGFGWGFVIGLLVGLAVGACGVYFAIDYFFPTSSVDYTEVDMQEEAIEDDMSVDSVFSSNTSPQSIDSINPGTLSNADSIKTEPVQQATASTVATSATTTQSAPETHIVKDTVKRGYLLNDMAKKHYGNKCFWVYIYEENKSKISNPNRVSPGMELVIPAPAKYDIDASSQASIKAANAKAGKILAKFPK